MAKKSKEKTMDLFYLDMDEKEKKMGKKKKNKNKELEKKTKDNVIDFDNEIIIGVTEIPDNKPKSKENKKPKKQKKKKKNISQKKSGNSESKQVKTKKITKEQEQKIKKRKKRLKVVKCTSLILIILGGMVYFLLSPIFNIKNINVTGNEKIAKEEIISLSGIHTDDNIFSINKIGAKNSIKENAYIDSVEISRDLPDTINIEVKERKETFMIKFGNAYVYLNNQGYMLKIAEKKLSLPILTGIKTQEQDIHEGNRLCEEDLQKLEEILKIMEAANSQSIGSLITEINIEDKQNYILRLEKEKKTVQLGDTSNLSTKMLHIVEIIENEKDVEGEILVNTDLSKGSVFRKKV